MAYRPSLVGARAAVAPRDRFQPSRSVAVELCQLCMGMQLDIRRGAEAIDQVARHGRGEAGPAHQDMDACCVLGQKDCRLAGGVASADEGNFRLLAHLRFESRSPVPHATAFEFGKARHVRTAVACAAGDHDRARPELALIGERQGQLAIGSGAAAIEGSGLRGNQDLCAEFLGLHVGAAGERLARDASRKAEIILDARACARLPAERPAIEHDHVQAFRGGVDGGGQPRRSGAHDRDVEQLVMRGNIEHAQASPQGFLGRVEQHRAVGTHRQHRA